MKKSSDVLPLSCPPRGLARPQAATYIGISESMFDRLVKDGRMPRAIHIDGRVVWDRLHLDEAFNLLADNDNNPWDTDGA
jgi:predicted DNA-binding transcriptional regulator AlpA